MTFNYSVPGQVSIEMSHYVKKMVKEFPQENLKGTSVASLWNENLFKVQHDSAPIEKEQAEIFHTVTAQGLFLCKHGHPDIAPAIAYLTTWVQKPNCTDWTKLCRMLQFLKQTVRDKLILRADESGCLKWHCNVAFVLHNDLIQFPPEMDENWVRYGLAKLGQISKLPNWQKIVVLCVHNTTSALNS